MSKRSVVIADIPFGSVYAYRKGDTIEDDAVKQNGWEDYVASPTTKEAKQALGVTEPAEQEKGK
jgi:Rad3-related DNA helicase